jgi:hypothetical protein
VFPVPQKKAMHWNARPLLYRGLVIPTLAAALPFFFVMTFCARSLVKNQNQGIWKVFPRRRCTAEVAQLGLTSSPCRHQDHKPPRQCPTPIAPLHCAGIVHGTRPVDGSRPRAVGIGDGEATDNVGMVRCCSVRDTGASRLWCLNAGAW